MLVTVFFRRLRVPGNFCYRHVDAFGIEIVKINFPTFQVRDLEIFDIIDVSRIRQQRGNVGGKETIAVCRSDHHGTVFPDGVNFFGTVGKQHGERVRPPHFQRKFRNRFQGFRIFFIVIIYQFGRNFGIRLGIKVIPSADQFCFQFGVIFDDAVMHGDDRSVVVAVRVCICFVRNAVRRPAGVTDPAIPAQRLSVVRFLF